MKIKNKLTTTTIPLFPMNFPILDIPLEVLLVVPIPIALEFYLKTLEQNNLMTRLSYINFDVTMLKILDLISFESLQTLFC